MIRHTAPKPCCSLLVSVFLTALLCLSTGAQEAPRIPEVDRIRLAEAFRLGERLGEKVWNGWGCAPFALLLVTPEHEFLVSHPNPAKDFAALGQDLLLNGQVFPRKRVFDLNLLAVLFLNSVPTIILDQAENTAAKTSTRWVLSELHEHFHQLQYAQHDHTSATGALSLARGDETGMCMLNFPFPYQDAEVKKQFASLGKMLSEAVLSANKKEFARKVTAYFEARRKFQQLLKEDDYKYFSFQLWQEGIARCAEYRIARLAVSEYQPSREFASLKGATSFWREADSLRQLILELLLKTQLDKQQQFGCG